MTIDGQGPTESVFGQPASHPTSDVADSRAVAPTQTEDVGQPEPDVKTAAPATPEQAKPGPDKVVEAKEEVFFDPADIKDKPELMAAYKQMQAAFTKKTQTLAEERRQAEALKQKAAAVDAFAADPVGQLQQLAQRAGFKLVRPDGADPGGQQPADWQPQSWDEVMNRATEIAKQQILGELTPVFQQMTEIKKSTLEKQLDDLAPDWRTYEDSMIENLYKHPSLKDDPATLYRISVPTEVWESRATQRALKKLEAKTQAGAVGGTSTTKAKPGDVTAPRNFQEAYERAKAQLAEQGLTPGR